MLISFHNVLQSIYASSALSTMSPLCAAPLLQPDHEPALRRLIADCMYMLIARFPRSIRLDRITDDGFRFSIPAHVCAESTAGAIEAMLARTTLATIGHAAGINQHLLDTLIDTLPQPATTILITPYS